MLDLVERLRPRGVVPGHGAAFEDVAAALQRARARLAGFRAAQARLARHGAKLLLLKYHLMERRSEALAALRAWVSGTPIFLTVWEMVGAAQAVSAPAWGELLAEARCESCALSRTEDGFADA